MNGEAGRFEGGRQPPEARNQQAQTTPEWVHMIDSQPEKKWVG